MELGQYQLQIFVSLVVILGAAFVALICDFLKGNNEQLRELTVELKVRREEQQRLGRSMSPRTAKAPAAAHAAAQESVAARSSLAPAAAAVETKPAVETRMDKKPVAAARKSEPVRRQASPDALAAMERGARLAGARKAASAPSTMTSSVQPPPLPKQEPQRPAALLEAAPPAITITNVPSFSTPVPEMVPEMVMCAETSVIERPVVMEQVVIEHPVVMDQVVIDEPVVIDTPVIAQEMPVIEQMIAQEPTVIATEAASAPKKKDWGALLARRASATAPVAPPPATFAAAEIIEHQSNENPLANIPAGFHDGVVLTRLILAHQPVTGLVVSIGVSSNPTNGVVPEPVMGLMRSLIGADDFACPTGTDEFLLIYPRLSGAAAQRQLSKVAQQLWDFQLRSLGNTSILFSWGGVEVASESIDEAIASASERMNETRRGRKLITMPLRQAV